MCAGYRRNRNLQWDDSSSGGGFTELFGFGSDAAIGGGPHDIPDGLDEESFMEKMDRLDFSDLFANFGLSMESEVPDEASSSLVEDCDAEVASTKKLFYKLLDEDLSMQCLSLLKKEMEFECIALN